MNRCLLSAIEEEQALAAMLSDLKARIAGEVQAAPAMNGVTQICDKPRCCMVSYRTMSESLRFNMSPTYYLQGAQADAVVSALSSCRTVTDLVERLQSMIKLEKVTHGEDAGAQLNARTLQVLRDFVE